MSKIISTRRTSLQREWLYWHMERVQAASPLIRAILIKEDLENTLGKAAIASLRKRFPLRNVALDFAEVSGGRGRRTTSSPD